MNKKDQKLAYKTRSRATKTLKGNKASNKNNAKEKCKNLLFSFIKYLGEPW